MMMMLMLRWEKTLYEAKAGEGRCTASMLGGVDRRSDVRRRRASLEFSACDTRGFSLVYRCGRKVSHTHFLIQTLWVKIVSSQAQGYSLWTCILPYSLMRLLRPLRDAHPVTSSMSIWYLKSE
jgi:hypothetical protein